MGHDPAGEGPREKRGGGAARVRRRRRRGHQNEASRKHCSYFSRLLKRFCFFCCLPGSPTPWAWCPSPPLPLSTWPPPCCWHRDCWSSPAWPSCWSWPTRSPGGRWTRRTWLWKWETRLGRDEMSSIAKLASCLTAYEHYSACA